MCKLFYIVIKAIMYEKHCMDIVHTFLCLIRKIYGSNIGLPTHLSGCYNSALFIKHSAWLILCTCVFLA